MTKFHLTQDGPRICRASKKACPLGGEHFSSMSEAQAKFELGHTNVLSSVKRSNIQLPQLTVVASVDRLAGGRYLGCHVPNESLQAHLQAWRSEVGAERASIMESLKASRDRGYIYHLTVITPPEMKSLGGNVLAPPSSVDIAYKGIGKAVDDKGEAWFVVCDAPSVQDWRALNDLEEKDLHITLGFEPKDVHSKSKGSDSIVIF